MTSVLLGMLLLVVLALAVVAAVAYPHLREGSRLLSPEGERLARESTRKARALADQAAQRGADALASVKELAGSAAGIDAQPERPGGPAPEHRVPSPGVSGPGRTTPPQQKASPVATPAPGTTLPAVGGHASDRG